MASFDKFENNKILKSRLNTFYGGRKTYTSHSDTCGNCFTDEIKTIFGVQVRYSVKNC